MRTPATRASRPRPQTPEHGGTGSFRADIEGLRAVAVGLVLLAHAGVGGLAGGFIGVDVFFVISGFLITGLVVREATSTGRISLLAFWARRAKRLLPASAVVLMATLLLTWVFVPTMRWAEAGGDIVAAAAYVVNWRLADRSVSYLAEDSMPSVVQHYWSLSVEEQFYLLWPLLMLLGLWVARRWQREVRRVLACALILVVVPSLVWSVRMTSSSPAEAYFVTPTRLWELGIGGLLALRPDLLRRLPYLATALLSWLSVLVLVAAALTFDTGTAWPGGAALVPTLATATVIACGRRPGAGVGRLLTLPLLQRGGALSYSIYLWHWPLLAIAGSRWGPLSAWEGLAIAAFSLLPAWVTHTWLEDPVRRSVGLSRRAGRALLVGACCTALGVSAGLTLRAAAVAQVQDAPRAQIQGAAALAGAPPAPAHPHSRPSAARPAQSHPPSAAAPSALPPTSGATAPPADPAAGPDVTALDLTPESISPDPLTATRDVPAIYAQGCQTSLVSSAVRRCNLGAPTGTTTVALVGDSKAAQWVDALNTVAQQRNWRVQTYLKASCPWADAAIPSGTPGAEGACRTWGRGVLAALTGPARPDVVIVSGVKSAAVPAAGRSGRDTLARGYTSYWTSLRSKGIRVIVLTDTPAPGRNVYGCVAEHRRAVGRCAFPRNDGSGTPTLTAAASAVPGTEVVTMNDWICPISQCPPVIGNVLIYRQGSHLTRTYVMTLARPLSARLAPAVGSGGPAR